MKFVLAAAAAVALVNAKDDAKDDTPKCEGIKMQEYKDADCKEKAVDKDKKELEPVKATDAQLKALNEKCNALDKDEKEKSLLTDEQKTKFNSVATKCDAKKMSSTLYTDTECKEGEKKVEIEWGKCTTVKINNDKTVYYKITGAAALQATAAIALAYVGAQF